MGSHIVAFMLGGLFGVILIAMVVGGNGDDE